MLAALASKIETITLLALPLPRHTPTVPMILAISRSVYGSIRKYAVRWFSPIGNGLITTY